MTIPTYLPYFVLVGTAATLDCHPLRPEPRARRSGMPTADRVACRSSSRQWSFSGGSPSRSRLPPPASITWTASAIPTIQYGHRCCPF